MGLVIFDAVPVYRFIWKQSLTQLFDNNKANNHVLYIIVPCINFQCFNVSMFNVILKQTALLFLQSVAEREYYTIPKMNMNDAGNAKKIQTEQPSLSLHSR